MPRLGFSYEKKKDRTEMGCTAIVALFCCFLVGLMFYKECYPETVTVKGKWWRTANNIVKYTQAEDGKFHRTIIRKVEASGSWHDPVVWNEPAPVPGVGEVLEKSVEYSVSLEHSNKTTMAKSLDQETYDRLKVGGHYEYKFTGLGKELNPEK